MLAVTSMLAFGQTKPVNERKNNAADVCTNCNTVKNKKKVTTPFINAKSILAGDLLFDNGPIITDPGAGSGGADYSMLSAPNTNYGFRNSMGYGIADDFTIGVINWAIDSLVFFGYQTGSTTTSTFTACYVRIWNGVPGQAGSTVIWGDTVTNILTSSTFSNIYRGNDVLNTQRPVMRNVCTTTGLTLTTGSYWVEYQAAGSLTSGPWVPPVTIAAQPLTGNAVQRVGTSFANLLDGTNGQGMPFLVYGTAGAAFINEIAMTSIDAPVSGPNLGSETVTISITNNGTAAQSNIPVSFLVNGTPVGSESIAGPVAAGTTVPFTFTQTADLSVVQSYTVKAIVSLVGDEFLNNDTLEITVVNQGNVIIMGTVSSDTTCSGTFTDSGSLTGGYQVDEDYTITFYPVTPGDRVRLAFTAFDIESGYDYLHVYDGIDNTATEITGSPFSGSTIPTQLAQVTATNPAGALTFNFTADNIVNQAGWVADISCYTPPTIDGGVTAITNLSGGCDVTSTTVTATITNFGINAISNFPVSYTVNGGAPVTENFITTIPPGTSFDYLFTTPATLVSGMNTINAYTSIPGDTDASNDASTDSVENVTPVNTPYMCDFETAASLAGWAVEDVNTDGYTWSTYTAYGSNGSIAAGYSYTSVTAADDWLYSTCVNLNAGTTYSLSFGYRVRSATYPENIEAKIGTAQSAGAMTTAIVDLPGIALITYSTSVTNFTVPTTGIYFVGFHCYSDADMWVAYIDDVVIDIASDIKTTNANTVAEVSVYPNPVKNILNVNNAANSNIAIYNILGEMIYSKSNCDMHTTIDMANFANGSYVVKITTDNNTITKKINIVK